MHFLVTGGCGFIGSHLCDTLLSQGHRITILDDLSTGNRANAPDSAKLIVGDVSRAGIFDDVFHNIDGCFHLAAIASVQKSKEDPARTHAVNFGGTMALLNAIARSGRKIPVIFASSAAVYGDNTALPNTETALAAPTSGYGMDKLACEGQGRIAAETHGIPTIGLRFFNVYGERQDPNSPYSGVISIFARHMKAHLPITIFGDGIQSRDFIYVGDVVRGMMISMQALESKKLTHGIFNICTGTQCSINRLAEIMAKITTSHSTITHAPPRSGDIRFSQGDIISCQKQLGFTAVVSLEEGLKKTLASL